MKKTKMRSIQNCSTHPLEILRCKEIERNRRNFLKRCKIDPAEIEEIMEKTAAIETPHPLDVLRSKQVEKLKAEYLKNVEIEPDIEIHIHLVGFEEQGGQSH